MNIVINSYYDHREHGRVKVVDYRNGVVSMEKQNEFVNAGSRIPAGAKQSAAGFQDDAEPADITITAKPAVFNIRGVNQ